MFALSFQASGGRPDGRHGTAYPVPGDASERIDRAASRLTVSHRITSFALGRAGVEQPTAQIEAGPKHRPFDRPSASPTARVRSPLSRPFPPPQTSQKAKKSALDYWANHRFPSSETAAAAPQLPATLRATVLRIPRRNAPEPPTLGSSEYNQLDRVRWERRRRDRWSDDSDG